MRRHAKWMLLLLAFAPGCLPESCDADCPGDGDADCSATTGPSRVATPTPSAALTLSCASRNAGPDTELEWELTVAGGSAPYGYTMDFGDGTPATAGSWPASGAHRGVHDYERPGEFQMTAQVRDAGGRSQSCGLAFAAAAPDLALRCTAAPRSGTAPLTVAFEVPPGGRRGCVGPCTVSWSFGDGATADGGHAVHEYTRPGPTTYEAFGLLKDGLDREARCHVPVEVVRSGAPEQTLTPTPTATPTSTPTPTPTPTPNHPPVITSLTASPSVILGPMGGSSHIAGSITDPDGDPVTWTLQGFSLLFPTSGSGGAVSATLTVLPPSFTGSITILLTARDSGGLTATATVTVTVIALPAK